MENVKKIRALVFDLDDTLYPEKQYVFSGFRAVADWIERNLGFRNEDVFRDLCELSAGGNQGRIFDAWLSRYSPESDGMARTLVGVYRDHHPVLTPFPEVRDVLGQFAGRYQLGILSDGYLGVQKKKLEALGLSPFFQVVVFSDEDGRDAWKPSAVPFEKVARQLGVTPERSVYIADNPQKDFIGARKTGFHTIRIRRNQGEYRFFEAVHPDAEPDTTISSLTELCDLFLP